MEESKIILENLEWFTVGAVIFGAVSEIIGMSKLKSNSVVQVAMAILGRVFGKR